MHSLFLYCLYWFKYQFFIYFFYFVSNACKKWHKELPKWQETLEGYVSLTALHFRPLVWPFYKASPSSRHSVQLYFVLTTMLCCAVILLAKHQLANKDRSFYSKYISTGILISKDLQKWLLTEDMWARWGITIIWFQAMVLNMYSIKCP